MDPRTVQSVVVRVGQNGSMEGKFWGVLIVAKGRGKSREKDRV